MHVKRYDRMRFKSKMQFVGCLLIGLLIALQLLVPSMAFANANVSRSRTTPALLPQQQEALDLTSVSVVRLVVTYRAFGVLPESSVNSVGKSITLTPIVSGNIANATILGLPAQLVIMVGVIVGLIILILLLVLVSLTFGRARARRRRELAQFKIDQAEAQRWALMEAQHQQSKITARLQSPFSRVRCPNCGVQVTAEDTVCPNCHYLLSASDSGVHLRAVAPPTVLPPPPAQAQRTNPPRVSRVEPTVDAFVQPRTAPAATNDLKSVPSQQCPRCGQGVQAGAVYCPHCRYQLVSSAPAAASDTSSMMSLEAGVVGKAADSERPAPGIAPQPIPAAPTIEDAQVAQAILLRLWERADHSR